MEKTTRPGCRKCRRVAEFTRFNTRHVCGAHCQAVHRQRLGRG